MNQGKIIKVVWPLVVASWMSQAKMYELVKVSDMKLMGEIIELKGDTASIQVYEDTSGIGPWEPVFLTWDVMSVELAPGLLESIYDGVQRPLTAIQEVSKSQFLKRWIDVPALDREKKWDLKIVASVWDLVSCGDILGTVQETIVIEHKVMVPPNVAGKIKSIEWGSKNIMEVFVVIETEDGDKELTMMQKWPIRNPRPIKEKQVPTKPLVTWGRSMDMFFPLVKGAAACIPGPFGAGKTVTQQGIAKYCDAQVIVYVGCGERGNEMTEVLTEFPHLKDPNTGEPLMKRTVMIANTSNMPVAAREASVYVGITISEYYRDMGYDVAMMADSTSRWAEAMREISGRLEEMPGEEWYPAYLWSRIAQFYERSGFIDCATGKEPRQWSLTVIGAVSPPGGDLSEPVTQNTLRVTKTFWGLDAKLAYKRHFPSINWLNSYSLYVENLTPWWRENIAQDFPEIREKGMELLGEESKLEEIVRLVGLDALSNREKLVMLVAKAIREDFLFQNAFDPEDAYTTQIRSYNILKTILTVYFEALPVIENDEEFDFKKLVELSIIEELAEAKNIKMEELDKFDVLRDKIKTDINSL